MPEGREVNGAAARFSVQNGLSNLSISTPLTVSTSSILVFQIVLHMAAGLISPVKITTGDGSTVLARIKIPSQGTVQLEAAFIADQGLQISVDTDNGGTLVTAAFTVAGVFHSNPSA